MDTQTDGGRQGYEDWDEEKQTVADE